jgi:hypothetical protein
MRTASQAAISRILPGEFRVAVVESRPPSSKGLAYFNSNAADARTAQTAVPGDMVRAMLSSLS